MEPTEDQVEVYLDMKEQAALEVYRKSGGATYHQLPYTFRETLEEAFLIGYGYGGIEFEDDLRKAQKNDPLTFYNWVQEGVEE